ncbi:NAD(P)/FAD-dependent oxidoreductase [Arthrobacter sp. Ld5]|uniref:NAD(P)/FAD-dependent oxidoreductase n=1 Tax=Arthrobacter sp. Ld5 TaxID=649152 RepID=UPI003EBB8277
MSGTVHVVVVGGGYAGVMAANRVAGSTAGRPPVEVTLVDPGAQFTERIRLHRVAAGSRDSAGVAWPTVLHPRVRRLPDRALRIDADRGSATLQDSGPLGFDRLVYAVGSGEPSTPLLSVTDAAAAARARRAIARLGPGATVTVAGAGPTGVELASVLAVERPELRITVVAPSGLAHPLTGKAAVARRLSRLGVVVERGSVDPATGTVTPRTPGAHPRPPAAATIWTAGFAVPSLAADSGLPVDGGGRLLVDATLAVPGHECILGAGDAVSVTGAAGLHLRASCAIALPMGAHAADNVLARLTGAAPSPIDAGYLAQCLDLGAGRGHVQFVRADDTARPWALSGRPGGWGKEQICRMTVAWLAGEARRSGSYTWPAGPAVPVG